MTFVRFFRTPADFALAIAALASASLLLSAHMFEWFAGLEPCPLCLDQRQAHWAALAVSLAGLAASIVFRARLIGAAAAGAAALVFLVSTGLAGYHAGVENKYWPGPPTCSGSATILRAEDLLRATEHPAAAVSCADAAWRFAGVSMAGYNMLASAGLFALCLAATLAAARAARRVKTQAAASPDGVK